MNIPKSVKFERFEFGGYIIEIHLLETGQTIIPTESVDNFRKAIMEGKVTDQQAQEFAKKLSTYKFSDEEI